MRRRHRCHRAALIIAGALAAATVSACAEEQPDCERCEFVFYWDSAGRLSASDETCREIACEAAICGLCTDITYNENDQPVTGTCDNCTAQHEPDCGQTSTYCPTHPDECAAEGVEPDRCGCYDLREDDRHCGACFAACGAGAHCVGGECVE